MIDLTATDPVVVALLRSGLDPAWTACDAVRRVQALGPTPVEVRRSRARILRGGGDRPGTAARRALVAADVLLTGAVDDVRPDGVCEDCAALRIARCSR